MLSIKRLILAVFTVFFISWFGTAVAAVSEGDVSQCPEHSSWYSESSGLSAVATCKCDDGYTADGTINGSTSVAPGSTEPCKFAAEFTITTIEDMADKTFSFTISAAGNYTIDWGDGTAATTYTATTPGTITHTYAAAKTGGYTIGITGDATAYNANNAAISFNGNTNIAELGGSLGAIFGGTAQPYMFGNTFSQCTNLTTIPDTLFSGVTGAADGMFNFTFGGCTSLQSIPDTLFSGVDGAAVRMFAQTFYGCTSLTEIPDTLFSGVSGAANFMFVGTFAGCTSLQSIPSGLFSGVDGAADYMFGYSTPDTSGTFAGCTSLTSIPVDLFKNVTGEPGSYAFINLFNAQQILQILLMRMGMKYLHMFQNSSLAEWLVQMRLRLQERLETQVWQRFAQMVQLMQIRIMQLRLRPKLFVPFCPRLHIIFQAAPGEIQTGILFSLSQVKQWCQKTHQ